ncbi:MAG: hypothetical protein ACRDOU_33210, partial [Streptosporangiaceae bacterium]
MTVRRGVLGWLMLIAAVMVIIAGYLSVPTADACNFINQQQAQLGQAPTCSTTPSAGYFIVTGLLAAGGLLFLAPALEEQRNGQWRYGTENGRHEVGRLRTVVRGHARVITFPQFT